MPRSRPEITYKPADPSRLPDVYVEAACLLIDLEHRGLIKAMGEKLCIRRQGGFPALDVVLLLLVYFASGARRGLRTEWKRLRLSGKSLAALAGRKALPSPAATSRALGAVESGLIRESTDWLLGECSRVDELLMHPASATWDARGRPWHVFDLDPTVTTLRHRGLPMHPDLPEPTRHSAQTGAPGHSGRKRGDIVLRNIAVQHAGSAAWIHTHLSPGNGEARVDLALGLDAVAATVDRLDVQRSRALVRMDGEFGHVPAMTACRERGLPFLVRVNRAALFESPAMLAALRRATWSAVPDSLSGPRRFAADVGDVTLASGGTTRRDDGSRYAPVTVRVVASVYKVQAKKAGRGRVFGGWRVELFAADLPVRSWPPQDCLATYFGRAAEENRFAQEDRETGLDRIVSYHLPGQELATAVGLFLWNLRLVHGFEAERPAATAPVLRLRDTPQEMGGPPAHWPQDPALARMLDKVDWGRALARKPDWSWCGSEGTLRCPDGRPLELSCVRRAGAPDAERRPAVFSRRRGGCEDCDHRPGCLDTAADLVSKHVELLLPARVGAAADARLERVRKARKGQRTASRRRDRVAVTQPMMLPAEARKAHSERFVGVSMRIELSLPAPKPSRPRLVAVDESFKQRRRKTWSQRVEDYALPEGASLCVHVEGGEGLRSLLGDPPSTGQSEENAV